MRLSQKELRKARLENLERLARWLGVVRKSGKNDKEKAEFLIYGILKEVKKLKRLPRGTMPSGYKDKGS